ncbi:hypothetical protein F0562_025724 [Nyssa sinensis]|uniref:CCHC-type domain-containing protein n=1 Tax=Nyssa sinensis TaxID=561372 RepID=A0A5J5BAW8_9ASTE|nr:hypothetical protein F0562_025724 [Nyssa sinensis]
MAELAVTFFLGKLSDLLTYETGMIFGIEKEINSLHSHLQWIRSFLKDADGKSKVNERVKIWVSQVRDVSYDAEDIIDAFIIRRQQERQQSHHFLFFIGFLTRMSRPITQLKSLRRFSSQIREIKETIEEISANKSKYCIDDFQGGEASSSSMKSCPWRETLTNFVEEADVVGIENDVKLLVNRLIWGEKRRAVVSIVGMGGLGKTTLAKKVYNNGEVRRYFSCHTWISISQEYNVRDLLQRVIQDVMVLPRDEMKMIERMDVQDLRYKLAEYLKTRRYLIVVDDIWSMEGWDAFLPAFPDIINGSRVMLTTRIKDVALYADAQSVPYHLKFLSETKCWELFCKKVFPGNARVIFPPELERLGKAIVAKCGGLPLAIIVLGSMLSRREKVPSEWEKIYKSISWQLREGENHISGILDLSYNNLPYYLKSCFLYCGSYPEDSEFSTRKLIKLWIAEGFIQCRGAEMMEEVAEDYLGELIQRSMIQVAKKSFNGRVKTCRIHDLLRDFAISEAKDSKFYEICAHDKSLPSMAVRRLVVHHDIIMPSLSCRHLRTFLRITKYGDPQKPCLNIIVNNSTFLRVLDLEGSSLSQLPNQVSKLVHLRYLGLRKTGLTSLPCSIGNLFNLHTLDIRETRCKSLPKNLLKNQVMIRHLLMGRFSFGVPEVVLEDPVDLPKHVELGNLRNLETVTGVAAGTWIKNSLEMLTNLRQLGIATVSSVQHIEGLANSLSKLDCLHSLWLEGKAIPTLNLAGHHNLYKIYLIGCLERLPNLREFSPNLTKLLLKASGLKQDPFPVLMKLSKLKILKLLRGAYSGKEMHCSEGGFLELEELDQLILNAIIGSLSPTLIPFIARATTSRQAWTILANTYAQPSHGWIKQVKGHLKNPTKGSQSVTDFLQPVKAHTDELALLGVLMDDDDLIEKILNGLDSDYKDLVHVVHACNTPFTFDEFYEKLLTFEAHLQENKPDQYCLPASANPTHCTTTGSRSSSTTTPSSPFGSTNTGWRPSSTNNQRPSLGSNQSRGDRPPPRPYLGYCQICGIQGHTAKRCPSFCLVPNDSSSSSHPLTTRSTTPWQPRAHFVATSASTTPSWLLDSGVSHHNQLPCPQPQTVSTWIPPLIHPPSSTTQPRSLSIPSNDWSFSMPSSDVSTPPAPPAP